MKSNKIQELNQSKTPIIVFDKELEKLQGVVLFPEKLKRANEILKKVGLPKEIPASKFTKS
jgi:hypothetical protein